MEIFGIEVVLTEKGITPSLIMDSIPIKKVK
jgi:hypothetical protein